jgi:hypothetical protein
VFYIFLDKLNENKTKSHEHNRFNFCLLEKIKTTQDRQDPQVIDSGVRSYPLYLSTSI